MKKTYLSVILDCIFCFIATFILLFTTLNYFTSKPFALITSITGGVLISVLITKISSDAMLKSKIKESEKEKFNEIFSQLNLFSKTELLTYSFDLFSIGNRSLEKKKDYIIDKDNKKILFFKFGFEELSKKDVVTFFNELNKSQTAEIYACSVPDEVLTFADRFKGRIKIFTAEDLYLIIKKLDFYPKTKFTLYDEKKEKKFSLSSLKSKKKAPKFFISGLAFLSLSYLVPFKIYYILSGSLMILFSLFIIFFARGKES